MQAATFLARFALTVEQAADFIMSRVNDPVGLFTILRLAGVGVDMVAQILQARSSTLTAADVRAFFSAHQLDAAELDSAYFHGLRHFLPLSQADAGHNLLIAEQFSSYIDGADGNDSIVGSAGDDVLIGGSGNDAMFGEWGSDYLEGGPGADHLEAGELWAWIEGRWEGGKWMPRQMAPDWSSNLLLGGAGDDSLYGGHGADRLDGGEDDDKIEGRAGEDTLIGGNGNDSLYAAFIWGADGANDSVSGGAGDDSIFVQHNDWVDAGSGNDRIWVSFVSQDHRVGVVIPGEGADSVEVHGLMAEGGVHIDLTETLQSRDSICWTIPMGHDLTVPALTLQGFDPLNDLFGIGGFDTAFQSTATDAAEAVRATNAVGSFRNYSQILTSPNQAFQYAAANPSHPDQHGKGFFMIQGAAAGADNTITVAAFLDPYGNNHRYGRCLEHYFFVNVGATDSALYLFRDDGNADSHLTPRELIPLVRFIGLRTENFTSADLLNVFI